MLIFFIEPDATRAWSLRAALRERGYAAAFARDFAAAELLLAQRARPGVVYIADSVPPLAGADLMALLERNPSMAGVPLVAGVADVSSLMAKVLERGGVRVVDGAMPVDELADLLATLAATLSEDDWRSSVLAWSRYLQLRSGEARERIARAARRGLERARRG